MTVDELLKEGQRLQRPAVALRDHGTGPVAAHWYEYDPGERSSTGFRCRLTIDASVLPKPLFPPDTYLTIFTNEEDCEGGRVEMTSHWPARRNTPLYAHRELHYPPFDGITEFGSEAIKQWLSVSTASHGYLSDPQIDKIRRAYEQVEAVNSTCAMMRQDDAYAVLAGWHWYNPDDDWYERLPESLIVTTIRDAEPWVEVWLTPSEEFRVIQRIT